MPRRLGETAQIIRGFAGLTGGSENRPLVAAQELQPAVDIAGMAEFALDPQMRTEKGRRKFRNQLLGSIRPAYRNGRSNRASTGSRVPTSAPVRAGPWRENARSI